MPFTPEQRQAIVTLNMAEVMAGALRRADDYMKKGGSVQGWVLTTPEGAFELTFAEVMVVKDALLADQERRGGSRFRKLRPVDHSL